MKRREFVSWMSVGTLAASLPVVLAACNSQTADSTAPPASDSSDTADSSAAAAAEFEAVGTVEELTQSGQLLNETAAVGPVLVISNPEAASADDLIAVNPTCTHAGCTVEWQSDQNLFVCPCHNSQFQPDGTVASGPAPQALTTYEVKQESGSILVKDA